MTIWSAGAAWPSFDAGTAINQALSALYTLVGVFTGAWLAFLLGRRQLRNARAIDRRLDWGERLHDTLAEYHSSLVALMEHLNAGKSMESAVERKLFEPVEDSGRRLRPLLDRADLYATPSEHPSINALQMRERHVRVSLHGFLISEEEEAKSIKTINELLPLLNADRNVIAIRVRGEMGLAPITDPTAMPPRGIAGLSRLG